jgi:hypothetical protein
MPLTSNFTDGTDMATVHAAHHNAMAEMLNAGLPPAPRYVSQRYYTQRINAGTVANYTSPASQVAYLPVFIAADVTIDAVGINVTTAGSANAVTRIGLYSVAANKPAARLYDWGGVATDTTGQKLITGLSVSLTVGYYCFALSAANITPGVFNGAASTQVPMIGGGPTAFNDVNSYFENGTGVLPATASPSQTFTATLPLIAFKVA